MIHKILRGLFSLVAAFVILMVLAGVFFVGSVELLCRPDTPGRSAPPPPLPIREAGYHRDGANTYLAFPQWYTVYSTEDFARFLDAHPESAFPYWSHIGGFWRSTCAANRVAADFPGNHAAAKLRIDMIGLSYTLEYTFRGFYEGTVGRLTEWLRGPVRTREDDYVRTVTQDYAAFLRQAPWYEYPFFAKFQGLWNAAPLVGDNPPRNIERHIAFSLDYLLKTAWAEVVKFGLLATSAGGDPDIMFVIRGDPAPILAAEPEVKLVRTLPDGMALLSGRGDGAFTGLLERLADANADIVEIAGNRRILMSAILPAGPAPEIAGAREIFSLPLDARPGFRRAGFDVDVASLSTILRADKQAGIEVERLYDY